MRRHWWHRTPAFLVATAALLLGLGQPPAHGATASALQHAAMTGANSVYDPPLQGAAPNVRAHVIPGTGRAMSEERQSAAIRAENCPLSIGFAAEAGAGPGSAVVKYSYPPNRGFLGGPVRTELRPGAVVDRYGADSGTFVSPQGTPFGQRSLPPSSLDKPFNTYEVVNPVQVNGGTVAPWFGQGGGGVQYEFGQSIAELIEGGFLKAVR